jgi:hemolysin III
MERIAASQSSPGRTGPVATTRSQSREEEILNSLSHGLGLAAAVAAGVFLLVTAIQRQESIFIASASVYVATLVFLYLASTLYHGLPDGRAKAVWLVADHAAIFLFIAGTYTPFTLGVLRGPWGWALFGLVWGLAVAGITFKVLRGAARHPRLSTAFYLAMGWVFVLAAGPVWQLMPMAGLLWLLAGGLAYTVGVGFFQAEGTRYAHFVWHWCVLAGTVCHFVAVLYYAGGV